VILFLPPSSRLTGGPATRPETESQFGADYRVRGGNAPLPSERDRELRYGRTSVDSLRWPSWWTGSVRAYGASETGEVTRLS